MTMHTHGADRAGKAARGDAPSRPAERPAALPLALVSTRVTEEAAYVEKRSALAYDYVRHFEALGYVVVPVPANTGNPGRYLDLGPALVVLTGGNNVDPALYGARAGSGAGGWTAATAAGSVGPAPGDETSPVGGANPGSGAAPAPMAQVYPERDATEFALIHGALDRDVPLLGICRGMHTINVFFGGGLTTGVTGHVAVDHKLVSEDPDLAGAVVNSYHGQGIRTDDLAAPLEALAETTDGFVEAFVHPVYRILALEWHPERQDRALDARVFERFLAGEIAGGKRSPGASKDSTPGGNG